MRGREGARQTMMDLVLRFLAGGVVVSFFAMLGDVLRPKSFGGLFSAAPSVALATIALTIHKNGKAFAAQEAQTMMLGAAAFLVYAVLVSFVLRRYRPSALKATIALLPVWFAAALGSWLLLAGGW
jgi:hydrogenase-4 membrane subunit HyfE